MPLIYRPNHPMANENGMIPRHIAEFTIVRPGFHIISDTMPPIQHMGTGRIHDSKSEFRKDTRAMGLTEVGNDPAARRPGPRHQITQADIVPDVKRAIEQLRSR